MWNYIICLICICLWFLSPNKDGTNTDTISQIKLNFTPLSLVLLNLILSAFRKLSLPILESHVEYILQYSGHLQYYKERKKEKRISSVASPVFVLADQNLSCKLASKRVYYMFVSTHGATN